MSNKNKIHCNFYLNEKLRDEVNEISKEEKRHFSPMGEILLQLGVDAFKLNKARLLKVRKPFNHSKK